MKDAPGGEKETQDTLVPKSTNLWGGIYRLNVLSGTQRTDAHKSQPLPLHQKSNCTLPLHAAVLCCTLCDLHELRAYDDIIATAKNRKQAESPMYTEQTFP